MKQTIKKLRAEYETAKSKYESAKTYKDMCAQALAEYTSPVKVGDVIQSRNDFHTAFDGYFLITQIKPFPSGDEPYWVVGAKYRKDGTEGKREFNMTLPNDERNTSLSADNTWRFHAL